MAKRTRRTAIKKRLTAISLERMKGSDRKQFIYDTVVPGLCVCVHPSGLRVFLYYSRQNSRAPIRHTIERFPKYSLDQARDRARELAADVARGLRPHRDRQLAKEETTLGELNEWYIASHSKPHNRTWKRDVRRFKLRLGHWENKRLSDITRAEVIKLHKQIGAKHPYAANDTVAHLRHMFKRAYDIGYRGENPAEGIERFEEHDRERFLDADELARFFPAVEKLKHENMRDFFKLALFCGARRANVAAMRWDEVHLKQKLWRIPAEKFKNKKPMTVVLTDAAIEILQRRYRERGDSPWVLPGRGREGHLNDPKAAWANVKKWAKLPGVRIHDLRRTLGSWQAANNASLHIIGRSLGHRSQSATAVYARLNFDPIRSSMETATQAIISAGNQNESEESQESTPVTS